ncbi:MAG: putative glycolipid-binding domain-containing protein [Actinophytocola sp.]|uniref:putative glycolipid-binding domain-containing protein n=1 Tax=Actinophytocola sp. TaxID=1872138 RepID=UPI003D6A4A48
MSAPSRKPIMMTWQGVAASPRLESVRLLVSDGRLRASGRVVAAASPTTEAFSASFEFTVARSGDVGRGLLRTFTAEEERQISVGRTEDGVWLIDHGQGTERNEFDGAADVDVSGLVTFTALPIRRLGLHRKPGEHDLPVVYVTLPDLSVRLSHQTYRTVSVTDDGAVINYSVPDFSADLTVDRDGLVIDYPGIAKRV